MPLRIVANKVIAHLAGEKLVGFVQGICEGVNFAGCVVKVETRSGYGGGIEPTHQKLGAVVSRSDANSVRIQKSRQIVWVDVTEVESHYTTPLLGWRHSIDGDVRHFPQSLRGIGDQLNFVGRENRDRTLRLSK